ncbi:MAG: AMIN domain-containing protein [Desulfovibrionaceae bacterium]|nr:AMIN domain-containing protein [Desulfovibrionaceae bacterium]
MNKSILILTGMVIGGALLVMANQEYKKEQPASPAVAESAVSSPVQANSAAAPAAPASESVAPAAGQVALSPQQPMAAPAAPSNSYTAAAQPVSPVVQDAATAPAKAPAAAAPKAPEARHSAAPAAAPQPKAAPAPKAAPQHQAQPKAQAQHQAAPQPRAQAQHQAAPAPKAAPTAQSNKAKEPAKAAAGVISGIRVVPNSTGAQVHIKANAPVHYTSSRMSNPERLVIDLQGKWKIKAPGVPKNSAVSNVRIAKWEKTTRIVLDLKKKNAAVQWEKSDPAHLTVKIK